MKHFAYSKRGKSARIAYLRERARVAGRRSQEIQAAARLLQEIGPRPTMAGELLRVESRYDCRSGEYVRMEVYSSLRRRNQRDVVVWHGGGVDLVEGISEGEIRDRRFAACRHLREIVEG